ncbi:cora-domain-containing protein [Dissoconium aciculare CBS 342.82]|uniref:Magnesium transporter n=1 Tax=Dissoconium aciculare CBS 342.82 TaxID=1314786 RepID=A0A6J3M5V9_9PEZI|nr:cora-domain-containing protein [Dissoconium aciculare CBS 342.82]KAF1823430.1 cora-domain-containing protein [Dissoconium aciculare CBS 342.82]
MPPLQGFLDDSPGIGGRIIKPSNELKLRCTEFDEHGNVTLVNGEFRKSELIAKYSLLPRDLRKIDNSVLPHILIRPSAILINLLHLRCLIKHNRVLVFDVYGSTDSYSQSLFMYDLEGKLRQKQSSTTVGNLAYEFRALEAVLISVTTGLESEFEGVREPVMRVLRELEEDIDRDKLRYLLIYSKKLGTFEQKARLVRDAIDDLLEADDDLAAMYLTEKAEGIEREDDNHEEIELLLESYHKVADEIVQISSNLVSAIRNTEEIVRAILDANRNSLMLLDLKFSIGTLGISAGMFIAALYGMNLENFIEESPWGFFGVSGTCTVLSVIACVYGFRKLRAVQRLSMWGEGGLRRRAQAASRRSWHEIGTQPQSSSSSTGSSASSSSIYGSSSAASGESSSTEVGDKHFAETVTGVKRGEIRADTMKLWKNVQRDRLQQALEREGGGSEQAGTGQATSSSSSTTNKGAPYSGPHDDPMKG